MRVIRLLLLLLLLVGVADKAFPQASQLPPGQQTFVDSNGSPLVGGQVFFYVPGTTTPKLTWKDAAETTPNTNPIVLDGAGRAIIYGNGVYRQIVQDSGGNLQWDQLTTAPFGSGASSSAFAFDSRADAILGATANMGLLTTGGYTTIGDTGGGTYKLALASQPCGFTSTVDGSFWQPYGYLTATECGADLTGHLDTTPVLQNLFNAVGNNGNCTIWWPNGNYSFLTAPPAIPSCINMRSINYLGAELNINYEPGNADAVFVLAGTDIWLDGFIFQMGDAQHSFITTGYMIEAASDTTTTNGGFSKLSNLYITGFGQMQRCLEINGAARTGGATFTGSIAGTVLTVTNVATGALAVNQLITGAGVTSTTITSLGTGAGGTGTYNIGISQTIGSEAMSSSISAAGLRDFTVDNVWCFQANQLPIHVSGVKVGAFSNIRVVTTAGAPSLGFGFSIDGTGSTTDGFLGNFSQIQGGLNVGNAIGGVINVANNNGNITIATTAVNFVVIAGNPSTITNNSSTSMVYSNQGLNGSPSISGNSVLAGGLAASSTVNLTGLNSTPGGKQPLCIDTSNGLVYKGNGGVC